MASDGWLNFLVHHVYSICVISAEKCVFRTLNMIYDLIYPSEVIKSFFQSEKFGFTWTFNIWDFCFSPLLLLNDRILGYILIVHDWPVLNCIWSIFSILYYIIFFVSIISCQQQSIVKQLHRFISFAISALC